MITSLFPEKVSQRAALAADEKWIELLENGDETQHYGGMDQ